LKNKLNNSKINPIGGDELKTRNYDSSAIGIRIKKARERLNITQEYISEKIDVGPQHISDIERGAVGISIDTLIKLCGALEVTADYILFGKDTVSKNNTIYQAAQQLSGKDQTFIEDLIEVCLNRLKNR
jgi:transcriptional regulator with XRE-family HTH domain